MRRLVLVSLVWLVAVACQTTNRKIPEGRIDTLVHPEYAKFRPVQIAVLKVRAPTLVLRQKVRAGLYGGLIGKMYSPFKLATVDAHTGKDGKFAAGDLECDATLTARITRWKPIKGTRFWAGNGTATLVHESGEKLWSCTFEEYPFEVRAAAGNIEDDEAAAAIASLFLTRLPDRPPLPPE